MKVAAVMTLRNEVHVAALNVACNRTMGSDEL
jgi:hypothetical protein